MKKTLIKTDFLFTLEEITFADLYIGRTRFSIWYENCRICTRKRLSPQGKLFMVKKSGKIDVNPIFHAFFTVDMCNSIWASIDELQLSSLKQIWPLFSATINFNFWLEFWLGIGDRLERRLLSRKTWSCTLWYMYKYSIFCLIFVLKILKTSGFF